MRKPPIAFLLAFLMEKKIYIKRKTGVQTAARGSAVPSEQDFRQQALDSGQALVYDSSQFNDMLTF